MTWKGMIGPHQQNDCERGSFLISGPERDGEHSKTKIRAVYFGVGERKLFKGKGFFTLEGNVL